MMLINIGPSLSSTVKMRAVLVVILAVLALGSGLPHYRGPPKPRLDGRIVGGQPASILDIPYQVSFLYFGSHICGGSIVSARVIVTAAHCTDGGLAFLMSIRAGSSALNAGGVVAQISSFVQHPLYDYWTIDWDLSLLLVDAPLTLGPGISPVGLPYQNQDFPSGVESRTSGWGHLYEGSGVLSPDLQVVSVPLVSLDECREAYGFDSVTERMICAGVPQGGLDACQGDSGGPLVVYEVGGRPILVGATSWGLGCARAGYPGVYARVAAFRDFIATEGWV